MLNTKAQILDARPAGRYVFLPQYTQLHLSDIPQNTPITDFMIANSQIQWNRPRT
jgi:hypothetical protein